MRLKSFLLSTLALAAGLLTIQSCTAGLEQLPQRGPVSEEADFLVVTENPVTKTVFDGEHTLWAESDKITAINIEDGGNEYFASSMSYRGDNRFGGRVTYAGDVNNWYLIYPHRADNVTPVETHINIPEVQTQNGNDDMSHIAGDGFPLIGKELGVARSSQLQVTMRNVLARLDFKVTNSAGSAVVFKQVVFTAPAEITGDFVGDITNDTPSWTAGDGAFKSLTLDIVDGAPVADGQMVQFHAGIAPLTVPANGSMKAKVVAVDPDDPENDIVFYHDFNVPNGTTLRSGVSYGFNMSFDTEHGENPNPDVPVPSGNVYVKASSLTVGGTYLIVDHQDQRLFKGSTDGSYVSVSPVNGVITDTNNSLSAYEFTVTKSNNVYCIIFNDNRYLVCDYSSNSSTGIRYENSKPAERYLYSLTINDNGGFEFSTDQMNSTSTNEILYYKSSSNYFKIGGSGAGIGVHLYLKDASATPGKQPQSLSFSRYSVTETMAEATGTLAVQPVSGAQTNVNYYSSNANVATVSGTTLYIQGFGTTTITAIAEEDNVYSSASISYELTIARSGSTPTGSRTYTYVAPGSLEPGTYLIAGVETGELSVALFPTVGTASWNSQTTGQVNNGQYVPHKVVGSNNSASSITTEDAEILGSEVVLAKSGSNWTIQVKSTGQYLVVPSQDYRVSFVGSSSATAFEISNGTNGATVRSGNYYFYHSGSAGGFTFRTNSTSNIRFYQAPSDGTTPTTGKKDQNLTFSNPTVNWTLGSGYSVGNNYSVQTPNNYYGYLTYTSGDTNVATVSGNRISIVAPGYTKITVTASGNDDYNPGTASYMLYILPESGMMVYNLENDCVSSYLDAAMTAYTGGDRSSSLIKNAWGNSAVYGNFTPGRDARYDCPRPVPISWSTVVTGEKTVYIYNNSTYTDEELHVTSTGTSADVYNLIPGRTYYYRVMSGSQKLAEGAFMTSGRRRMIKVSDNYDQNHANNCRDLGGQTTINGKTIKYGKIFRGSNMDDTYKTTNGNNEKIEQSVILNYLKIRLDVDLRAKTSSYATNRLDCGNNGNNMCNALQFSDIPVKDANTYIGHTQEEYDSSSQLRDPEKMRYTLTRIFNAVHNGANVYIHCLKGADRTGFTCMMLEAILGVPLERCDMDYEMTSFSVVGARPRNSRSISHYNDGIDAINARLSGNSSATFQDKAIDYAVNVLGVNRNAITQFQNDMLE